MISFYAKKAQTIGLFSSSSDADNEKPSENHDEFKTIMPLCSTVETTETVTSDMALPCVKKDPGGLGFLDEVRGSVKGLVSCTESLGSESSDERSVDDILDIDRKWEQFPRRVSKRTIVNAEVKKFPPPLSSLNHSGKPNFFLRPMRKDGRLELTEVEIERPWTLSVSREDGRLRLDLITELELEDDEEEDDEEEIESAVEEKEEEKDERWEFPVITCDGGRFRRCHEAVTSQHGHHDMHDWRQLCVAIR